MGRSDFCKRPRTVSPLGRGHYGRHLLPCAVFGLFLTEMLLRSAALALFVVFAIAFQEDIRRTILLGGTGGSRIWKRTRISSDDVVPLVRICVSSVRPSAMGILIVLQGRESLDASIRRGWD